MILLRKNFLVTIQAQKPQTLYSLTLKFLKNEKEERKKTKIYNEKIILRKRKKLLLSKKVHVPLTFLITRVFLPHYWFFKSSGGYKER